MVEDLGRENYEIFDAYLYGRIWQRFLMRVHYLAQLFCVFLNMDSIADCPSVSLADAFLSASMSCFYFPVIYPVVLVVLCMLVRNNRHEDV